MNGTRDEEETGLDSDPDSSPSLGLSLVFSVYYAKKEFDKGR